MPISFNTAADTGISAGDAAVAAIQPISNGEPVNQTTLRRPSENLRIRTETLKTAALALEARETEDAGAFVYSEGGTCTITDQVKGAGVAVGYPLITAKEFLPLAETSIVVVSPAIAGGKVILKRADFESFYSEGAHGDHHLVKRGDCIALKFPRSGANTRSTRTWGNDLTYPSIAGGNIGPEAELVKLPSRVVLNTPGKTLLTTLGPAGTGQFNAAGVPIGAAPLVRLTGVSGNAPGWWFGQGGSGDSTVVGTPSAGLRVSRITETTIEVTSDDPWRILWPSTEAGLSWSLGALASGTGGYITAKDYSDYHIIPLITYTGTGYVFSPAGGFLQNIEARLLSFTLPISDLADLASEADADEGADAIGSFVKSSSGDVDTDGECATNGGVQLIAGTLSEQLTAMCKEAARRTRALTFRALVGSIANAGQETLLPLIADGKAYVSTDERLVRVWFNIEASFGVANVANNVTLSIGHYNVNSVFTAFAYPNPNAINTISLVGLEPGLYEVPLSSGMYDWTPVQVNGTAPRLYARFSCGGVAMNNVTSGIIQVGAMVREVL